MSEIKTLEQLNELYAEPSKRAKNKVLLALDAHAITLINHCHFAVLGTTDSQGFVDLSPKGGEPGFIQVIDESTPTCASKPAGIRAGSKKKSTLSSA